MKRAIRAAILLLSSLLLLPLVAMADLYQYEDEQGTVHFTDDPATIPKRLKKKTTARQDDADGPDRVTRVTIRGNQVLVPVTLSHRGKVARGTFLLDTGASTCTISPQLASRLGIGSRDGATGLVQVVGGEKIPVGLVSLDFLDVGPRRKYGVQAGIITSGDNDGLLGMNFLRELRYHIDFDSSTITWGD